MLTLNLGLLYSSTFILAVEPISQEMEYSPVSLSVGAIKVPVTEPNSFVVKESSFTTVLFGSRNLKSIFLFLQT